MKRLFILSLPLFFTFGCANNNQFQEVPKEEINKGKVAFAKTLANDILTAQREGGHYPLNTESATPKMVKSFTASLQESSYKQIRTLFGDYQEIEFKKVMKPVDDSGYEVYIFTGTFESSEQQIRVVLNSQSKLSGFWIKPLNSL